MKLHKARRLGMKWKSRRVSPNLQQFKKKTLIIIYLFLFADGVKRSIQDTITRRPDLADAKRLQQGVNH